MAAYLSVCVPGINKSSYPHPYSKRTKNKNIYYDCPAPPYGKNSQFYNIIMLKCWKHTEHLQLKML